MKKFIFLLFLPFVLNAQIIKTVTPTWVRNVTGDSLDARFGAQLDMTDLKEVSEYEPVMQDSSIVLYNSGTWSIFDLGQALVALAQSTVSITYPDANTIDFNNNDQILLDPLTLEIDGSNQLTIVGGAPLAQTAFDDSLNANFFTGIDSIHYGADSIVVTHGVGIAPSFVDIQEMSDGFGYRIWVNVINAATFSVKRNSSVVLEEPTTYIKFRWMAMK